MTDYQKHFSTRQTPQSEPIPGSSQVENSAGGYAWQVGDWERLDRFLVLGASGGTYYIGERELTIENAEAVHRCLQEDGPRTVARIVEISQAGRAPKNDPALFALAMCAGLGDDATRKAALTALPQVARIGTHLFNFLTYVQAFRGWGRGLRRAISNWYTDKDIDKLAYQVIKYRQRGGWTHRDGLRLSHPRPGAAVYDHLFRWITQDELRDELLEVGIIRGFVEAQQTTDEQTITRLIREYNLTREMIPTELLTSHVVWDALLDNMPMTALVRNLGNMGKVGLLAPGAWEVIERVTGALADTERLRGSRLHPLQILAALVTYSQGHGMRGSGQWTPVPQVIDALDAAFYTAFDNVEPTGKRWLLGLDVSISMTQEINGIPGLMCLMAGAVMAMVTARVEQKHAFVAFSDGIVPFPLSPTERLDDVITRMQRLPFAHTDCALPMIYAQQASIDVDVFAIYTDNETWFGQIHPAQALQEYRRRKSIPAKLAVVGMASNGFSIADPDDPGMLDFVGMDISTPAALAAFATM